MVSWAETPATKRAVERKERAENITRAEYHGRQEGRGGWWSEENSLKYTPGSGLPGPWPAEARPGPWPLAENTTRAIFGAFVLRRSDEPLPAVPCSQT